VALIALEGIDGAGTTTQTRLLQSALTERGHSVHATCEPSQGPVGKLLREILRGDLPVNGQTVALLFAADRLHHVEHEIQPAERAGRVVISDRYVLSSLAYQSLECDEAWVTAINRFAPPADLTLLLDVPVEIAAARRAQQGRVVERFDALDMQRRVAQKYRELAARHGAVVIDGSRDTDQVLETLLPHVYALL
jgi:dTMP kinase